MPLGDGDEVREAEMAQFQAEIRRMARTGKALQEILDQIEAEDDLTETERGLLGTIARHHVRSNPFAERYEEELGKAEA